MRKSVSVVLVVIMLLTMLTPFSWFSANAKTDQTLFINEVMSSNESLFGHDYDRSMEVKEGRTPTGLKT